MEDAFAALMNGLPVFLVHSILSLIILLAGVLLYMKLTAHDEMALIRNGNSAASLSLGGAIVGLAIPLGFSLSASLSLWDLLFWGLVALVLQLAAFRIVDGFLKDLPQRIEADDMAAAILLVAVKLATAIINAAAISG